MRIDFLVMLVMGSVGEVTLKRQYITSYLIHEIIYYYLLQQVTSNNIAYYCIPLAKHCCGAKLPF